MRSVSSGNTRHSEEYWFQEARAETLRTSKSSRTTWSPLRLILMSVLWLSHFRTGGSCGGAIGWQRLPVRKTPRDGWLIMHDTKNVCVYPQIWLRGRVRFLLSFSSETRFTGLERIEGRQVDRGSKGQTVDRPAWVRVSVGVILKRT